VANNFENRLSTVINTEYPNRTRNNVHFKTRPSKPKFLRAVDNDNQNFSSALSKQREDDDDEEEQKTF